VSRRELKMLYGAITQDMRDVAMAGGPEAIRAFERANTMWSAGMTRVDNFLEGLASKGFEPEKLFTTVERSALSGNVTMIRELGKTLSPEERSILGGVLLKRLGRAPSHAQDVAGERWSAERFFDNWDKLSGEAKDVFFGSPLGSTRYNLDKIAKTAFALKESGRIFSNPPNTAAATIGTVTYVAAAGSAITGQYQLLTALLGASTGGWAGAKALLTNPRFVNWLGQSTSITGGVKGVTNHVGRLASIAANSDPETRDAIKDYMNILGENLAQEVNTPRPAVPQGN
jgi:hypothetical protein